MCKYAQIDENNKVVAISSLADNVIQDNLIALDKFYMDILDSVYRNGNFYKTEILEDESEVEKVFNFETGAFE